MRIIYECEQVAVIEDNEKFIVHILDNYRMVKEIIASRNNLISTLKEEINEQENNKKYKNPIYVSVENILKKTK